MIDSEAWAAKRIETAPPLQRAQARHLPLHYVYYTVYMGTLRFGWGEREAAANFNKHGVGLVEQKSVFVVATG